MIAKDICKRDFDEVVNYFRQRGTLKIKPSAKILSSMREIHAATYSLFLWRYLLKHLPEHSIVFLNEISSDAIQILPLGLQGYRRPTLILIRSIIENCCRHIYFSDHPIEFILANQEKKWFISQEELFKYLNRHPLLKKSQKRLPAINKLQTLYDDLSAKIHGRKIQHFEMRRALTQISFNQAEFEELKKYVKRCSASVNFLFMLYHQEATQKFQEEFKRIILRTMPPEARQIIKGINRT